MRIKPFPEHTQSPDCPACAERDNVAKQVQAIAADLPDADRCIMLIDLLACEMVASIDVDKLPEMFGNVGELLQTNLARLVSVQYGSSAVDRMNGRAKSIALSIARKMGLTPADANNDADGFDRRLMSPMPKLPA